MYARTLPGLEKQITWIFYKDDIQLQIQVPPPGVYIMKIENTYLILPRHFEQFSPNLLDHIQHIKRTALHQ